MSEDHDDGDFEDIVRQGPSLAGCTIRCGLLGREGRQTKRVSITFRAAKLDPEVVEILSSPALSAAYSPSQRVVRVRADDRGSYRLTLAPKSTDVYLLRFPWPEKMPWVDRRVEATVDFNVGQRAIFVEIPGVTPARALALPAPVETRATAVEAEVLEEIPVPTVLARQTLSAEEAALLGVLSAPQRFSKETIVEVMELRGYGRVAANALLGKLRRKLSDHGVEPIESSDGKQTWLSPTSQARLRELVAEAVS
jgi:hypothetical protein